MADSGKESNMYIRACERLLRLETQTVAWILVLVD